MIHLHDIVGLFRKSKNNLEEGGITPIVDEKMRCPVCKSFDTKRNVAKNKMVCPSCGHHFRIGARIRVKALCDKGSFQEILTELTTIDPLDFPGYDVKMESGKMGSGEDEAVLCGRASFKGQPCALFVMEPQFM